MNQIKEFSNHSILIIVRDISSKSAGLSISTFLRARALSLIENTKVKILTSSNTLDRADFQRLNREKINFSLSFYREIVPRIPSIFSIFKIFKDIKNSSIIYIYSFYQPISYLSFILGKLLKKEIWFRPHGSLMYAYTRNFSTLKKIYTYFELLIYSSCRYIVLSSNIEKYDFIKFTSKHILQKTLVEKLRLSTDSFNINKNDKFFTNNKFNYNHSKRSIDIIFLSRLINIKGVSLLLEALKVLCEDEKFKSKIYIVIAGIPSKEFTEKYNKYKIIFKKNKYLNIKYKGMVSQSLKWKLLHDSKYFILPTFGDSFGIAALEALFSNTKVISSNKLGCSEIINKLEYFEYIDLSVLSIVNKIKEISNKNRNNSPNNKLIKKFIQDNLSIRNQCNEYSKIIFENNE